MFPGDPSCHFTKQTSDALPRFFQGLLCRPNPTVSHRTAPHRTEPNRLLLPKATTDRGLPVLVYFLLLGSLSRSLSLGSALNTWRLDQLDRLEKKVGFGKQSPTRTEKALLSTTCSPSQAHSYRTIGIALKHSVHLLYPTSLAGRQVPRPNTSLTPRRHFASCRFSQQNFVDVCCLHLFLLFCRLLSALLLVLVRSAALLLYAGQARIIRPDLTISIDSHPPSRRLIPCLPFPSRGIVYRPFSVFRPSWNLLGALRHPKWSR